jgi:conjugative relaxase-like TrwC/TraI family protein
MVVRLVQSKSARAAKKYFRESLSRPDYYGRDGYSPGIWFGEGARRLGLEGPVSQEDFFALADNKVPASYDPGPEAANDNAPQAGSRLTVRDKANRRPGYDFVFSPPKSVSSLWARADAEWKERLVAAFRQSVLDTLREDVEPEMKTRLRRNGQDGDIVTGNMVGSLFLHESTRPLEDGTCDPHLHLHAYCFNATWVQHENRWQAAQLGDLHRDRPYVEAAFKARLAKYLEAMRLPVEHQVDARGRLGWEIAGVPESVIAKDSRRTEEIEAEAKRKGITDPAEKGKLGAKTRRAKDAAKSPVEVEADWHHRLSEDEHRALQEVMRKAATTGNGTSSRRVTPGRSMEHAAAHVFARESAVSDKELLAEALRYGAGSVLPEDVKKELDGHGLILATIGGRRVATNAAALADDQAVTGFARKGRGRCRALKPGRPHLFGTRDGEKQLDDGQKEAVQGLLDSIDRNRVTLFLGKAGVGKTTTLKELEVALNERGRELLAFAPTSRASRGVLRSKGFPTADTLAQLTASEEWQERIKGNVVLIDEVGMAGTKALRDVFAIGEKHLAEGYDTRFVLTGDAQQHRGVPRGSVIHLLQEHAGLEPVRLSKIRRQRDVHHREAVEELSEGLTDAGLARLDKHGFVREIADAGERYRTLAREFADMLAAGDTALLLSPTHAEGRAAYAAVREELKRRESLGVEDHALRRYESKGLTEAQKQDAVQYQAGDMVQWHEFAPGFRKGEQVTVLRREENEVRVAKADGKVKTLPLEYAERFELYRTGSLAVAEGERLRVTRNGSAATPDGTQHRLNNGDLVTVRFTEDGDLVDQRGWIIGKEYGHLAPAILTSHASQGVDEDWVFVAQSGTSRGASSAQQIYVSASRGVKGVRIYTDDKEGLRQAVSRSEKTGSAIAVWEAQQKEADAARELIAERQGRQRYLSLVEASREREEARRREELARRQSGREKERAIS